MIELDSVFDTWNQRLFDCSVWYYNTSGDTWEKRESIELLIEIDSKKKWLIHAPI
jgi:hypothetical protein